jgi:NAD(P)H-flavin reductase
MADELSKLRLKVKCLEQTIAWEKKRRLEVESTKIQTKEEDEMIHGCSLTDIRTAITVLETIKSISTSQHPEVDKLLTTVRNYKPKNQESNKLQDEISQCIIRNVPVTLLKKTMLNEKVICLKLQIPDDIKFDYQSGQYLYLTRKPDGLTRRYSIGSVKSLDGNIIELNVRHVVKGEMSTWMKELSNDSETYSTELLISGPCGSSTYRQDIQNKNIVMVGVGTGMTPLLAVLRDAICVHGHHGQIQIVHSNTMMEHAYYIKEILEMEKQYPNITYYPCVRDERNIGTFFNQGNMSELKHRVLIGKLDDIVANNFRDLSDTIIYTCGFSNAMRTFWSRLIKECNAREENLINDPFWK